MSSNVIMEAPMVSCGRSVCDVRLRGPPHRSSYWLRVVLVVVAVTHRRLGPSSSATTSTTDRALPSSAVQLRCWSRPTTTTRLPFDSDLAACSAWSRQTTTVKNDASCSLRPDTATRNMARTKERVVRLRRQSPGRPTRVVLVLDQQGLVPQGGDQLQAVAALRLLAS